MDNETESQIQELRSVETNFQSLLMQKQAFYLEMSETENALSELEKAGNEVYKISGSVILKSEKNSLINELSKKRDLLALRIKNLESQEKSLSDKSEKLREKVLAKIKQNSEKA
jgi:prefoldin beta subunit